MVQCAYQFRTHDISCHLWTFPKWQETDSISTLQLASLPTLIESATCIINLYYQGIISLWVWVITFPVNVGMSNKYDIS